MDICGHFNTVMRHKLQVMKNCFRCGLYIQGIMHDMSKFSPEEFIPGVLYYQGSRSPNNAEREDKGLSYAWVHHKGRNKHHYEYWTDYSPKVKKGTLIGVSMPRKYVAEMFCDRVGASKVYNGKNYSDAFPLAYLCQGIDNVMMAPETKNEIVYLLLMLKNKGEDYTFKYIKKAYLKGAFVPRLSLDRVKKTCPIPEEMSR